MYGVKDCEFCIYLTRPRGEDTCTNKYVVKAKHKPDPYNCEFCDTVTDDYISDMDKVRENT